MPTLPDFDHLIRRVRAGDPEAASELVRRYEPYLRRTIRFRLAGARRGYDFDSVDICQMVWASFFVRAAAGQYDLASPQQTAQLLVAMARKKLAFQERRQRYQCRDHRRVQADGPGAARQAAPDAGPPRRVAAQELWQEVQRRLSPEERRLVALRSDGWSWAAVAVEVGGAPDALRKKLARAVDRVAQELGLEEEL